MEGNPRTQMTGVKNTVCNSVTVTGVPDRRHLRRKGIFWLIVSEIFQLLIVGKAWWLGCGVTPMGEHGTRDGYNPQGSASSDPLLSLTSFHFLKAAQAPKTLLPASEQGLKHKPMGSNSDLNHSTQSRGQEEQELESDILKNVSKLKVGITQGGRNWLIREEHPKTWIPDSVRHRGPRAHR